MTADVVVFAAPVLMAAVLAVIAGVVWHRNLGPTPLFWALIGCTILLVSFPFYLAIGIWLGDR
jgi:hypothetical protein